MSIFLLAFLGVKTSHISIKYDKNSINDKLSILYHIIYSIHGTSQHDFATFSSMPSLILFLHE